jgi:hypothetical protein
MTVTKGKSFWGAKAGGTRYSRPLTRHSLKGNK